MSGQLRREDEWSGDPGGVSSVSGRLRGGGGGRGGQVNTSFSLVNADHVTRILAADWSELL